MRSLTASILAMALGAMGLLTACNGIGSQYTDIQKQHFSSVGNVRGMECDGLPLECNGWRFGGTTGGYGGSFPADQLLWISKAEWEQKYQTQLKAEGVSGWDQWAAKHGKPNGEPINKTLRSPVPTNLGF